MDPNQAPEVVPYSNLEHYNQDHSTYSNYQNNNKSTAPLTDSTPYVPKKRKIAGLAPTTFWLLIALAVVTIAAAVGGGVGGSMAVANAKKRYASTICDGVVAERNTHYFMVIAMIEPRRWRARHV